MEGWILFYTLIESYNSMGGEQRVPRPCLINIMFILLSVVYLHNIFRCELVILCRLQS